MSIVIRTVGHSNHAMASFLDLLAVHSVRCLVDVRSVPWSRRWPWFRKRELADCMEACGIAYHHLGRALGGKPRAGETVVPEAFDAAVDQVMGLARLGRVALMCSEADPARCHRSALLAPAFQQCGARILHVLADGSTEDHAATAARMAPAPVIRDLFAP